MGYESLGTSQFVDELAGYPVVDVLTNITSRDFSYLNGKSIVDWKKMPSADSITGQFDAHMVQIFKEAVLLGHRSGVYAGKLSDGTRAFEWMVKKWEHLNPDAIDTFAFRDWIGKQFAPFSSIPNPHLLKEAVPVSATQSDRLNLFISKAAAVISQSLELEGKVEFEHFDDLANESFPVSDGWLLNVTAPEFFQLIGENWPESMQGEADVEWERKMLVYFEGVHLQNMSSASKVPTEKIHDQLGAVTHGVLDAAGHMIEEKQSGGRAFKYIKRKKKDIAEFRNFQSASKEAAGFSDLILDEASKDERVDPVVEEYLWEQIGRHYNLNDNVVGLLREHPEARSAIKTSIKLSPLYLGQRTIVGWPFLAGLISLFESTPGLHNIIHSNKGDVAVLTAGTVSYLGARLKSSVHKTILKNNIGSADLVGTLAQIHSLASSPNLNMSQHANEAAAKSRRADMMWLWWPTSLYGVYKFGHATEYLLSANINFAIEAAMIKFHARQRSAAKE